MDEATGKTDIKVEFSDEMYMVLVISAVSFSMVSVLCIFFRVLVAAT